MNALLMDRLFFVKGNANIFIQSDQIFLPGVAEAAAYFLEYLFFFSKSNVYTSFPGANICSSNNNTYSFLKEALFVFLEHICLLIEQMFFPQEALSVRRMHAIFQDSMSIFSLNFSKSLYFTIQQISIFQEALSSHRTHMISRRSYAIEKIYISQEGTFVEQTFQQQLSLEFELKYSQISLATCD